MKTILIIGMGRFGHHLCINFSKMNNEVMIIDKDEDKVSDLLPYATTAKVGDCTNEEVLKSLGISNFDLCFICIGSNFQSSLEITSLVKEMGGKYVVSKANRDIHAKFLLRNGADEVVYPDRDIAEKIAVRHSANHVFDYVELTEGYSIL
ncbi:potassium channel family protein, partial [Robinsoniella sp.]